MGKCKCCCCDLEERVVILPHTVTEKKAVRYMDVAEVTRGYREFELRASRDLTDYDIIERFGGDTAISRDGRVWKWSKPSLMPVRY